MADEATAPVAEAVEAAAVAENEAAEVAPAEESSTTSVVESKEEESKEEAPSESKEGDAPIPDAAADALESSPADSLADNAGGETSATPAEAAVYEETEAVVSPPPAPSGDDAETQADFAPSQSSSSPAEQEEDRSLSEHTAAGSGAPAGDAAPSSSRRAMAPTTRQIALGGGSGGGGGGGGEDSYYLLLHVEEAADFSKPYMGGLRNKNTGVVYHHAYTQTPVERVSKWANAPPRFSRDTQTAVLASRAAQGPREGAAQTNRSDLHREAARDVIKTARPYFTADQLLEVKHANALRIQCQWRGALARKRAEERQEEIAREWREAEAYEEAQKAAAAERMQRDIERRMHPKTEEDFGVLFDEVEAWRVAETGRAVQAYGSNGEKDPGDPKAFRQAMKDILSKESALIATIERLRTVAGKENRQDRLRLMMENMAAPQILPLSTGDTVAITTPLSARAAELKALYEALEDDKTSRDARTEILLNVKYTVKEFDCSLTREIASLVDRETDMLSRGRPLTSMSGLRVRILSLFQYFVADPQFNPSAAAFVKVPLSARDPKTVPSFLQTTNGKRR